MYLQRESPPYFSTGSSVRAPSHLHCLVQTFCDFPNAGKSQPIKNTKRNRTEDENVGNGYWLSFPFYYGSNFCLWASPL